MIDKITARAREFGPLGTSLLGILSRFPHVYNQFGTSTFTDDLIKLRNVSGTIASLNQLLPAAISLLCLPFPLQIKLRRSDILRLTSLALALPFNPLGRSDLIHPEFVSLLPLNRRSLPRAGSAILAKFINDEGFRSACCPHKALAAAGSKTNVTAAALARSFSTIYGAQVAGAMIALSAGYLTEDQFCSALIYGAGLHSHFGLRGFAIALWSLRNTDGAKGLSTALKALGANSMPEGAVLCEMASLRGRAVGDLDLSSEASYRCDPSLVKEKLLTVDPDDLRQHVAAVINHELSGRDVALPDLHQWWSARWAWCVNGSQTARSARALGLPTDLFADTHDRMYRRMAAETLTTEPVTTWDGTTDVSASAKLECGKTRAIFACDTRSYFAFEWVLSPVQRAWRNDRVLLDPGFGGHLGVVKKVQALQRGGGVNLMLDYDDFNSAHSTPVMQMVFDVLCTRVGAPDWYRKVLIDSFERGFITIGGRRLHVEGTLMSGHRGTTFINSILNAAYLRHALGGHYFDSLPSIHTGDDVYLRPPTLADCDHILRSARDYGCRMNPTKQSVGFETAEFLRIAMGKTCAYGYFARAVSSFVNGNWANLDPLAGEEALLTAMNGVRSLSNRSATDHLPRLIAPALRHTFGLGARALINLLSGRASIEGSPLYDVAGPSRAYRLIRPPPEELKHDPRWPTHATNDYLTDHTSEVEALALSKCGGDISRVMAASSYSKGRVIPGLDSKPRFELRATTIPQPLGFVNSSELIKAPERGGFLSKYPLLSLVKNRLSDADIRELVIAAGGTVIGNVREFAFGPASTTKNFIGRLSYADAGMLSKRTTSGNIFTLFPVNM
uniref:RNA-directed RNA polymerase n=1 Tax=Beauveria bassiana victorivirus 1 TaxID=1685109 RepID=A0A142CKY8_9VIRU|nr:RNA-dependent RNA polymerase [Beauveria bassiana victorivirus 1]